MPSRLTITPPPDYRLHRDVCSYGYFLLAPNRWDPASRTLQRSLALDEGAVFVTITQRHDGEKAGEPLVVRCGRTLTAGERASVRRQVTRMLSLDTNASDVKAFHRIDPRWKRSGRARLFRSPTLFEDVIKTVTSCNVTWGSTITMNRRLCEVAGRADDMGARTFPDARRLARTRVQTLRSRCSVGYRDRRIVDLAKRFAGGKIDEQWLERGGTDDEVFAFLKTLPGIGPYAAGNIMQLLARFSRLALDTESVRHAKTVLEMHGSEREIMKRLAAHYEPFGEHRFRSYWFELWDFYERKHGKAWTWERETTGAQFTAAKLNATATAGGRARTTSA